MFFLPLNGAISTSYFIEVVKGRRPGNELFAGGIIFALGLHLGGEKCDLKKVSDLTAFFFMQKYEFLP